MCAWVHHTVAQCRIPSRVGSKQADAVLGSFHVCFGELPESLLQFAKSRNTLCLSFRRIHPVLRGLLPPHLCPHCTLLLLPATTGPLGSSLSGCMGRACTALQVHIPVGLNFFHTDSDCLLVWSHLQRLVQHQLKQTGTCDQCNRAALPPADCRAQRTARQRRSMKLFAARESYNAVA